MAHARAESTRSQIIQGSDVFEACTVVECNPGGDNLITVTCFKNGTVQGTPLRLKITDNGKWAGDYPGLNNNFVTTEDGHIGNG